MASYREDYYSKVDEIFEKLKHDPFAKPISDPTQYEIGGVGHIQPVGWVSNASSEDGNANVIIDADGITIYDGKIFLYDYGGSSVLGAAGFGGSWIDFITNRVYNGIFRTGTPGAITVSEVGGADTVDEYEASLSAVVPYWIAPTVTGSMELFTDATAPGGQVIRWSGTSFNATLYQDIPVTPGRAYMIQMLWKYTNSTSEFSRNMRWTWRDKNHVIIGTADSDGLAYTTSQAAYTVDGLVHPNAELAPTNAAYLRIETNMTRTSGSPDVRLAGIALQEATVFGPVRFVGTSYALEASTSATELFPRFRLNTDGVMEWGPGGASSMDNSLIRVSSGIMRFSATNAIQIGAYPALSSTQVGEGSIELRASTPYIDFTNDNATDFDARIILEDNSYLAISGAALRARMTGTSSGATTSLGSSALEVFQGGGSTADAYMTFHVGGGYALHFGMNKSTNDLFVGGWSMGAVKYKVWHAGTHMGPIDATPNVILSSTVSASTGPNLLSTGAPANATHVLVRIECEATTAHASNAVTVRDGTASGNIFGVAQAGAAAGYRTNCVAIVPCDTSRRIYYTIVRGAGNVTATIVYLGYFESTAA